MNLQQLETLLKSQLDSPTAFVNSATVGNGTLKLGKPNQRDRKLTQSLLEQLHSFQGQTKGSDSPQS